MRVAPVVPVLVVLVAAATAALFVLGGDEPERLTTQDAPASLVVRDGDRVTGTGRVVSVPGRPVRFCAPVGRPDIGYLPGQEPAPEHCETGLDVDGVDLTALADRRAKDGAVEGFATLTGTYADGTLTVDVQGPPRPYSYDEDSDQPPCEAPEGGWPRDPGLLGPGSPEEGDVNLDAERPVLERYRAEHPDDVVTIALLRPYPDSVLLGVSAADPAAAERAERVLRPAYGDRLCVVVSRYTRAQVTAAQSEVEVGSAEAEHLGVFGGAGEGVSDDLQVEVGYDVVMVTEQLVRRVAEHPPGLVELRPWLVPDTA